MKIENIKKVELIIEEIRALESFIQQLPDNGTKSDQIIFGNNDSGAAELKATFKGKNIEPYIIKLKCLVYDSAKCKLKELHESLIEL